LHKLGSTLGGDPFNKEGVIAAASQLEAAGGPAARLDAACTAATFAGITVVVDISGYRSNAPAIGNKVFSWLGAAKRMLPSVRLKKNNTV